ncbi:MAG: hypothetical protein H7A40_04835 [Chlamydiales bacterium]|nr:hypothetical protein [Chlamydiales bacterium]
MSNLRQVAELGIDLTGGNKYAYSNFVIADNTLISKIKDILVKLGLYKPDASSAAHKLIPIVTSQTFVNKYEELSLIQKSQVADAVRTVCKYASGKEQDSLMPIVIFLDTNIQLAREKEMVQTQKQLAIDDGQVVEKSTATAKTTQIQKPNKARNQMSNMRKLFSELEDICPDKLVNELKEFLNGTETPSKKIDKMISRLKKSKKLHLLNTIFKGEITVAELKSGEKSLAYIMSQRSQKR